MGNYFFLIFYIAGVIIQICDIQINVRDALFYGGFYIALGCLISKYEATFKFWAEKIKWSYLIVVFVIFNIIQILESVICGNRLTYSFSTIIIALVLFTCTMKNSNILNCNLINKIGKDSLWIYLIHPILIDLIYLIVHKFNISIISNTIIWHVLLTPIVFSFSYIIYVLLKSILSFKKN